MGCDIHYVVERKYKGEWLGLFSDDAQGNRRANRGNHVIFAELAGVRAATDTRFEPRGIPEEASRLARYKIVDWGDVGHTHSHLSLREFCGVYARVLGRDEAGTDGPIPDEPWEEIFDLHVRKVGGTPDDYRVIYWLDG